MGEAKVTYTIALVDKRDIVQKYLRPNYNNPGEALQRLQQERLVHSWQIYKVLVSTRELLLESELQEIVQHR